MRELVFALSILTLASCASAPEARLAEASASSAHVAAPSSSASVVAVPAPVSLAKAAIEQGIERDEPWVSFPWGRLSFKLPLDWTASPIAQGHLLRPPSARPGFAAALFVSPNEPDPLLALERALSISDCRWRPEQSSKLGPAKLEAQIVDGACRREDEIVAIARVRYAASGVVFFVWSKGADSAPFWQMARLVDNLAPQRLVPCCMALQQNAKSAPAQQIANYQQAADICTLDRAGANPDTLAKIHIALGAAQAPVACR